MPWKFDREVFAFPPPSVDAKTLPRNFFLSIIGRRCSRRRLRKHKKKLAHPNTQT